MSKAHNFVNIILDFFTFSLGFENTVNFTNNRLVHYRSPGIMLLIYQKAPNGSHVPLKILSIETGDVREAQFLVFQFSSSGTHMMAWPGDTDVPFIQTSLLCVH